MKKNTLLLSIIALVFLLTGCSLTGDNTQTTKACFSNGKSLVQNDLVEAQIVTIEDTSKVTQTEFTFAELENYQYGYNAKGDNDPYHVTYELCDLQSGEYLSSGVVAETVEGNQIYNPLVAGGDVDPKSYSSGNYSNFTYETESGEVKLDIETSGDYAVNVFKAEANGDWEWVDSLEFKVGE